VSIHVEVIKSGNEDKQFVYYEYQFPNLNLSSKQIVMSKGKLKIDKVNGNVHTIENAEGDNGAYAKRAAWTLIKYWQKGEYPLKAYWE
jgi:hypothetical protein